MNGNYIGTLPKQKKNWIRIVNVEPKILRSAKSRSSAYIGISSTDECLNELKKRGRKEKKCKKKRMILLRKNCKHTEFSSKLNYSILQGEDSTEYFLGLTPSGIIVLRNKVKVGNYFWWVLALLLLQLYWFSFVFFQINFISQGSTSFFKSHSLTYQNFRK